MAIAKTRLLAATIAGSVLAAVAGIIAYQHFNSASVRTSSPQTADTTASTAPDGEAWEQRFDSVYALRDGEVAKRIPPPFIPERLQWYEHSFNVRPGSQSRQEPKQITFHFDGDKYDLRGMGYGSGTVGSALSAATGISYQDVVIPGKILALPMEGDWVVRASATTSERVAAFQQDFTQATGIRDKLVQQPVQREVIVVTGTFKFTPLPGTSGSDAAMIHLFHKELRKEASVFRSSIKSALRFMPDWVQRTVVVEAELGPERTLSWSYHREPSGPETRPTATTPEQKVDEMLANLSKQTGLTFRRERRVVPTWVLSSTQPAS